ncbi:hypothetical protein [Pseudomethylobacillus aquaticus]|nr:hypothetical protein [Pseudomethylobacillus aquaticus]
MKRVAIAVVAFCFIGQCWADCLQTAGDFAVRICGEIQREGRSSIVEGNGELKASVSGIVRKALGEAGGSFSGKAVSDAYENVLRKDLGRELFDVRQCRQKMALVGTEQACKSYPSKPTSDNKQGLLGGTSIKLFTERKSLEGQLSRLGKACNWSINEQGSAVCSTSVMWMDIPASMSANFQGDLLSTLVISSYFSSGTQRNGNKYGPRESSSGDKASVDRYCSDPVRQQLVSSYVKKYGAPISPPEKINQRLAASLFKDWCEGRTYRSCTADGVSGHEAYVFRAGDDTLAQVRFESQTGSRSLETYSDSIGEAQWQSCRFTVVFLSA